MGLGPLFFLPWSPGNLYSCWEAGLGLHAGSNIRDLLDARLVTRIRACNGTFMVMLQTSLQAHETAHTEHRTFVGDV